MEIYTIKTSALIIKKKKTNLLQFPFFVWPFMRSVWPSICTIPIVLRYYTGVMCTYITQRGRINRFWTLSLLVYLRSNTLSPHFLLKFSVYKAFPDLLSKLSPLGKFNLASPLPPPLIDPLYGKFSGNVPLFLCYSLNYNPSENPPPLPLNHLSPFLLISPIFVGISKII